MFFELSSQQVYRVRQNRSQINPINNRIEYLTTTSNVTNTRDAANEKQEKRVISMSLYGSDPRYTQGAIENAKLIDKVFPGWKLRIYLSNVSSVGVPSDIVNQLKTLNVDLVFMNPLTTTVKPMMWRFLVASDMTVDRFIVRDADSRLISRDATEVELWIQSGKAFHCIRDHSGLVGWPVSGGLWGGIPSKLRLLVKNNTFDIKMAKFGSQFFKDMEFLRDVVWPQVKHDTYCSDSFTCRKWESSHPFATKRSDNFEFVGEVFQGNGQRRYSDFQTIKKNPGNVECIPK